MSPFDPTKLNDYAERMLSRFLTAFPNELFYSLENTENYYVPDGDRFVGAWVIEWLCPAGGYAWNVRLCSSEHQLTIRWGNDHEHFGNWDDTEDDPEVETCSGRLAEIFSEKLWYVDFYQGDKFLYGRMCAPDEIHSLLQSSSATSYKIKTWRGTLDKVESCDNR